MALSAIVTISTLVVALIFAFAGALKIADPRPTSLAVRRILLGASSQKISTTSPFMIFALVLGFSEVVLALGVTTVARPHMNHVALRFLALYAIGFVGVTVVAKLRKAPCGCGGLKSYRVATRRDIFRSLVLAALAVTLALVDGRGDWVTPIQGSGYLVVATSMLAVIVVRGLHPSPEVLEDPSTGSRGDSDLSEPLVSGEQPAEPRFQSETRRAFLRKVGFALVLPFALVLTNKFQSASASE